MDVLHAKNKIMKLGKIIGKIKKVTIKTVQH